MTAKEFLMQAQHLDALIGAQIREVEYWKDLSTEVTGVGFGEHLKNPNTQTEAVFVRNLEKIDSIQREIDKKMSELIALRQDINDRLNEMDSHLEQLVLRLRYLDNCTWEEIAAIIEKAPRTAYRIHEEALRNFPAPG